MGEPTYELLLSHRVLPFKACSRRFFAVYSGL